MIKITAGEKEERSKITLKGKHWQKLSIQCGKEAPETKKACKCLCISSQS